MEEVKIIKISPVHEDERGKIYDILEEQVSHIGMITSNKGSIRAKHYHKLSTQYTYMLNGKIELTVKDLRKKDDKPKIIIMNPGDLAIIPPNVVHKYIAIEDSTFLDFTTQSRADGHYDKDMYFVEI